MFLYHHGKSLLCLLVLDTSKFYGFVCCFRNAPLGLSRMLKVLTNVYVHPAHLSIFQAVQNLYTYEVYYLYSSLIFHSLISLLIVEAVNLQEELANLFVPTNVCLTSTDYQTAIHLWKISSIHLEGHFHVLFFCVVLW